MEIPFASVFEKLMGLFHRGGNEDESIAIPAALTEGAPAGPLSRIPPPLQKPSSEKLSKTVLPNTTRTIAPLDPFQVAAGAGPNRAAAAAGLRAGNGMRSTGLPPAVALALEPKVERTISLSLADFIDQMPAGHLKPVEQFETSRRILLKAAEVEKGMAKGKPTVSLASVYEQAPEIFLKSILAEDTTQVALPFEKVLEEFNTAKVRIDQQRDQAVPQVETPFLQATLEDSEKFGIEVGPLETCEMPPVRVQPASARAIAEAEPETLIRETVVKAPTGRNTIKLTEPFQVPAVPPVAPATPPPSTGGAGTQPPARIPFQLPPNGTGAPASERVPASSGPSVPTRSPNAGEPRPQVRVDAPSDGLRPRLRLVPGTEEPTPAEDAPIKLTPATASPPDEEKISLSLRIVLQNVPAFQLKREPTSVEVNRRVELPLSLIQAQLASGKVAVPPKQFQAAMPEEFRDLLIIDTAETPVMLPLQEVLLNLPGAALQMRADQEDAEKGEEFETPISAKAKEDAARFQTKAAPIEKAPAPEAAEKSAEAKTPIEEPEEEIDAREVVARAATLPGVAGCSVTFTDGLMLAGNFPENVSVDALCAVAPSLLQRIEQHMEASKLGALSAMTLHGDSRAVTFFMQGNICVTALHDGSELVAATQAELAKMTKQLSRKYAQPESAHVDH